MSSNPIKTLANQLNSLRSTGPRTATGKAKASSRGSPEPTLLSGAVDDRSFAGTTSPGPHRGPESREKS